MFDWLRDLLQGIWHSLIPWVVLQPYEQGVLVRLGKFKRVLDSGFHWVIPFHVDKVWDDHVTPTTHHLAGMATTTKDGKSIGFDAVVTYRISDMEKAVLRVTHVKDAIVDTCMGIIGTELSDATWEGILHGDVVEALTETCRKRGWKWGIEVMQVQLAGVWLVRNIRLSGTSGSSHMEVEHTV